MPLRIPLLLDDGPLVVMAKPGGLLTQAPPDIDSVEAQVRDWWSESLDVSAKKPFVGVPHRLDRPASGAIAMTRTPKAARRMADQFELREVDKTYWALVSGSVPEDFGDWSDFMRKVPNEARSEIVSSEHPDAQYALLKFKVLARSSEITWLEIRLETGRTHQIRLQCGSRGFPILGDEQYGSLVEFGPKSVDPRDRWIALHARRLAFVHPTEKRRVEVQAPLFDCWSPWIDRLVEADAAIRSETRLNGLL